MINFRQKEYSSLGTKLSFSLEKTKEFIREKKKSQLKKISQNSKGNEVKSRAARINLIKEENTPTRSTIQVKRDAIKSRDSIRRTIKNPKEIARISGKAADKVIQATIKRPQVALGAVGSIAIPATAAMINPTAGVALATLPIGTAINLTPMPSKVNRGLKVVARKYRGTNFSKRLGGRI